LTVLLLLETCGVVNLVAKSCCTARRQLQGEKNSRFGDKCQANMDGSATEQRQSDALCRKFLLSSLRQMQKIDRFVLRAPGYPPNLHGLACRTCQIVV
jgi:hypothetical protein